MSERKTDRGDNVNQVGFSGQFQWFLSHEHAIRQIQRELGYSRANVCRMLLSLGIGKYEEARASKEANAIEFTPLPEIEETEGE